MKQELEVLKAKFRSLSGGAKALVIALAATLLVGAPLEAYHVHRVANAMGGLVEDTNKIHAQQHAKGIKFGANVDHSTTTIHGGHSLVVPGDTLGGFMSGADKTKLDTIATGAQVVNAANVQTATAALSSSLSLNNQKLSSMADGTASSDGAAFHQIGDAVLAGRQVACDALSTSNLGTLSGLAQTVDGVALSVAGMRACLFGQTTSTQDGCYVTASGAWSRCTDLPAASSANHRFFVTVAGSANKGVWAITNAAGSDVVGTNDLVVVNQASGGGGGAVSSVNGQTGAVVLTAGDVGLPPIVAMTTTALPSFTYANGTAGVGATMTANANGAFPALDGVTLNVGDRFVNQNDTGSANGIYQLTNAGGVSSTWVATRDTAYDTSAELLGAAFTVRSGLQRGGGRYQYKYSSWTVGTDTRFARRLDLGPTASNEGFAYSDDLIVATVPAVNTPMAGGSGLIISSSTVTASLATNGSGVIGGLAITTSAAATSFGGLAESASGTAANGRTYPLDTNDTAEFELAFTVNTLSASGAEYALDAGYAHEIGASQVKPANGMLFVYDRPTNTNWQACCIVSSTATCVDTGVAVSTATRRRFVGVHEAADTNARFYIDNTLVATIAWSNCPAGQLVGLLGPEGFSSTGAATKAMFTADAVKNFYNVPLGRGL